MLAAGGDGTVRVVAAGLAGTGIAMAIMPVRDGQPARPQPRAPARRADGASTSPSGRAERRIDTIVLTVDDGEPDRFAVMAGTGIDAMIMDEIDERLKAKFIGPAAYFVAAGARRWAGCPCRSGSSVDGSRHHRRKAMICLIGNCGELTGGHQADPGRRSPTTGVLDVYVASRTGRRHWSRRWCGWSTRAAAEGRPR